MGVRNHSAWATGECPYNYVCDNSDDCPAIDFNVPVDIGEQAKAAGLDVANGFSTVGGNYSEVNVCLKALEDPQIFDQTANLETHIIRV